MAQLTLLKHGRCQFCHRTSSDFEQLIGGDSSFICNDCVAAATQALAATVDPSVAQPEEVERYFAPRLGRHFAPLRCEDMVATSRTYPIRQQADLQLALDDELGERVVPDNFLGIQQQYRHETTLFSKLIEHGRSAVRIAPAQYEDVELGQGNSVRCLKNGLWLLRDTTPYAVVLAQTEDYGRGASLTLEVVAPPGEAGAKLATRLFEALEQRLSKGSCYRGRVLSLEASYQYAGYAQRIRVHDLQPIARDEVVLPATTLDVLERNVLRFAKQRESLRHMGLSTQKGLLFHGPPGTGKTHSIRWLSGQLPGHTTLLITAEQVGLLPEYMALARLLQPALVVIEDADLIARNRTDRDNTCDEVMLNLLLNELDGLRERADIFFILTTNRPEALEPALASRPGRVDQAIEFPLPDEACRRRLIRLYAKSLPIADSLVAELAKRTEGTSPAFIKELLRRVAQQHIESSDPSLVSRETMEQALHEMLFSGGALNTRILGSGAEGETVR
jgi:hypothetical protein